MDILSGELNDYKFKHLAMMYATLGATNEAILHAHEPIDLYQRVCDAAVEAGNFAAAAVIIADWKTTWVTFKAVGLTLAMFLFVLTQAKLLETYGLEPPIPPDKT